MKQRLKRLLIPYIIYPIVVWISNNLLFLLFKFNRFNRILTFNELKIQFIVGRGIFGICVLWFIFNLIIISILFFIFSFFLGNHFLFCFQIFSLISYLIQYSEINYQFFNQYTIRIFFSVGNLVETLPIAIGAFSLLSINYLNKCQSKRKYIFFSTFFFYFLSEYNIFTIIKGYASSGIRPLIISIFIFTIFYLIPFEIINSKILFFIKQITKFTQGIYCLHFVIQHYFRIYLNKEGTLIGCLILYIISYFISFIGFQITKNTNFKFLFI